MCEDLFHRELYDSPYFNFLLDHFPADRFLTDHFPADHIPESHFPVLKNKFGDMLLGEMWYREMWLGKMCFRGNVYSGKWSAGKCNTGNRTIPKTTTATNSNSKKNFFYEKYYWFIIINFAQTQNSHAFLICQNVSFRITASTFNCKILPRILIKAKERLWSTLKKNYLDSRSPLFTVQFKGLRSKKKRRELIV
jgi:hypothetical protein